ncbi:methyltransferase domain-containing protein [Rhodoferax sp.]|uniref:methyltransferase domain-containing protein n=1 Tax=Rhodoferax sp. TaxID=50421 RepID=UPI002770E72F|nr:class I SAM-dependent methyltransferase [Rhodoferax sp.]
MHLSSLNNMAAFRDKFLGGRVGKSLKILDLGSTEMGACYRPIFQKPGWEYVGVDLGAGPNVDLVLGRPYDWREISSGSVDVLISGQVLEHVEFFWITMLEISRVLRPGAMACLIAPSSGPEHRYPVDCWRFYPDGMRALAKFARLECVEVFTDWENTGDPGSDFWHDSVLVVRKPVRTPLKAAALWLLQAMQRGVLSFRLS